MKWIITTFSLVILTFVSCSKFDRIEGNNNLEIETRQTFSFNELINEGDFIVEIIPDSVYQITVEAESNLLPHIRTIVHGNTLVLDTRENLDPNYSIIIRVKTPMVNTVHLAGSGEIAINEMSATKMTIILSGSGIMHGNLVAGQFKAILSGSGSIDFFVNTDRVETTLSGSGNIRLNGDAPYANHLISGSGNLDCYALPTSVCDAKISGSGNMYLTVSDQLNATITGSGTIFYHGSPVVNSYISGSGSVIAN